MKLRLLWVFPLCLLLMPLRVHADSTIVGYPTASALAACPCWYGTPQDGKQYEAIQFTLLGSFHVSQIDLTLFDQSTTAYTMNFSLQDALTNPANVFFSGSVSLPGTGSFSIQTGTLNVNSLLGPGTYYLMASQVGGSQAGGLVLSNGTLVSNGGTAPNGEWQFAVFDTSGNPLNSPAWAFFDVNASSCNIVPCNSATYAVVGTSSVPEPGTLLLLGTGLMGIGFRLRKSVRRS